MKKNIKLFIFLLLISGNLFAQNLYEIKKTETILAQRGEVIIQFSIENKKELSVLTHLMSIDKFENNLVTAYLNKKQFDYFKSLNYNFKTVLPTKVDAKSIGMATTVAEMENWDKYPTYEVYVQMMNDFATNYPSICKLESIGTSVNGRELLVLKISDNPEMNEDEPEFFYTSTMHGDETTGFVLMLRLIDNILKSYNPLAKNNNIIDNYEVFINPLANPDGTYYGGNTTVFNATRNNANSVDLNRDFPYPTSLNSPYQQETQLMMNFASSRDFVMSANIHGGTEVMNYPWDVWKSYENTHADDAWFHFTSSNYVQTARAVYANYMTAEYSSGVTEGADWYYAFGSRQDYMTYYQSCREVTIEISNAKLLSSSSLPNYWNYNKQAFLNYIEEAGYGIRGIITDQYGEAVEAKVEVLNHDKLNSEVYSTTLNGDYYRPIATGVYDLEFSADGYEAEIFYDIVAIDGETTKLDVILDKIPLNIKNNTIKTAQIYPNPVRDNLMINLDTNSENAQISIFDISGTLINRVNLNNRNTFKIEVSHLAKGTYFCKIENSYKAEFIKFIKL